MRTQVIASTKQAFRVITHPRLFESERAYAGAFAGAVEASLIRRGLIVPRQQLVELEPQKQRQIHHTRQRPDVIFHIPHIITGAPRDHNNYAVWAFKVSASKTKAKEDFKKIDEMIDKLDYRMAFFVNVDDDRTQLEHYNGKHADRLFGAAVYLDDNGKSVFTLARADG